MRGRLGVLVLAAGCGRVGFTDAPGAGDGPIATDICANDAPGLVGHWTLDAADVAGTVVRDVSLAHRDATLVGTAAQVAGPRGGALDFSDTVLTYLSLPGLPLDARPGSAATLVAWIRNDNPTVDESFAAFPPDQDTGITRYDLWLNQGRSGTPSLCINGGDDECWGYADDSLIGRWMHVAAVLANGPTANGRLYIDGAAIPMACRFGICDMSRAVVGPIQLGSELGEFAWRGLLDDVRIFDHALSDAEVSALHACP